MRNRGQIVEAARELVAREGAAVRMDALAARARWPIKPAARDLIARVREAWTPAPRSEAPATNG